jgi:uncharacterized protein YyaL (SSP411 family)
MRFRPAAFQKASWITTFTLACGAILSFALVGCSLVVDADSSLPEGAKGAPNRLSKESSPYLLAHARNPVDWYPWGPEALERARKEDKLIFLSIGYSSCHWCHVMEKRVFSDPEIARFMNENFVNIKVDREERPDVDDIYMTALTLYYELIGSQQSGGWPLSMFLMPDGRPIGGGTYFAPDDEEGRTGFPTMMRKVLESWRDNRRQMERNADILTQAVRAASRPRTVLNPPEITRELVPRVVDHLKASYDADYGGFGYSASNPERPKFPVPAKLGLLQYESVRHENAQAGKMLYHTLDRMASGGIYDHVGGGFHRYSTDRYWHVPHFEKMLYDNAQLADVYVEAYRHSGESFYRTVAEGIFEFVRRDLSSPQGAFYSSLDADSDGGEGRFYVWTDAQLAETLNPDEVAACRVVYGTDQPPAFEAGHVLAMARSIDDAARELKTSTGELERHLANISRKLLAARQKRTVPARDDKILTCWNGQMIRALARAGVVLKKPEYTQLAANAAEFILSTMRDEKGRLYRSYSGGRAQISAYLDDYAFLIDGLLALHLATGDEKWGNAARRLVDQQLQLFWDETGKGFYLTSNNHETLLARTKSGYDSVIPSGNSVSVRNLLRLASVTRETEYRDRARECLEVFTPLFEDSKGGMAYMALAVSEYLDTAETSGAVKASPRGPRLGIAPDAEILQAGADEPRSPSSAIQVAAAQGPAKSNTKKAPEYITGKALLSVDKLPPGGTCKVLVQLQIAEGWHIHANPAGDPEFDMATELLFASELGTELTKVRYPAGKKTPREGEGMPQSLYVGQANLLGVLEVPADAAGREEVLTIQVSYQACNDTRCLPPKKLELKLPVRVAAKGEQVRQINEKAFAPPAKK